MLGLNETWKMEVLKKKTQRPPNCSKLASRLSQECGLMKGRGDGPVKHRRLVGVVGPTQGCANLRHNQMAEAGWYYCPTPESDDFVKCPYCSLSLDGWEPKDKPL